MSLAWLTGALFGVQHVLTGPDHLAAVGPLAVGQRGSWRVGLAWGLGHALGVWGLAALVLWVGALLPLEALASWSERLVGCSVIAVGVWGLVRTRRDTHAHAPSDEPEQSARPYRVAAAVGTLHGLAGASHLVGVLPGLPLADGHARLAYLLAFGGASILTMLTVTAILGSGIVAAHWRDRAARASSWIAIGVGLGWLLAS